VWIKWMKLIKLTHLIGQQIAEQQKKYKVRSLLEPEITVTGPGGERLKNSKPGVHPTTAFDQGGASGLTTPMDSDTEAEITDIKRAQKLTVQMTEISSTPETGRCIRTIYRGDFAGMQKEASENQRRVRKYLCATDLSDEAAHALEWTVGTVLRDGDTLLAIYCVDEETGVRGLDGEGAPPSDSASITTQAASIAATAAKPLHSPVTLPVGHGPSPLGGTHSSTASPMGRVRTMAEQERFKAVKDITDRVVKLLRKTRLQVRVVIEVIHCKSPKHLVTEVIDFLSPTLVIIGSRGRSALKGSVPLVPSIAATVSKVVKHVASDVASVLEPVLPDLLLDTTSSLDTFQDLKKIDSTISNISPMKPIEADFEYPSSVILGSFSNYLVTKSSVPVMVARKRLRKHSKYKRPDVRLANNLTAGGRGLMSARVDEL
jgi:nucleotide-binding universal stress UspA family protein